MREPAAPCVAPAWASPPPWRRSTLQPQATATTAARSRSPALQPASASRLPCRPPLQAPSRGQGASPCACTDGSAKPPPRSCCWSALLSLRRGSWAVQGALQAAPAQAAPCGTPDWRRCWCSGRAGTLAPTSCACTTQPCTCSGRTCRPGQWTSACRLWATPLWPGQFLQRPARVRCPASPTCLLAAPSGSAPHSSASVQLLVRSRLGQSRQPQQAATSQRPALRVCCRAQPRQCKALGTL